MSTLPRRPSAFAFFSTVLITTVCVRASQASPWPVENTQNVVTTVQRPFVLTPGHVAFGFHLGMLVVNPSSYDAYIAAWGYSGFSVSLAVSTDVVVSVNPWLWLGARFGYQYGAAGNARIDNAALTYDGYDVGFVTRFGPTIAGTNRRSLQQPLIEAAFGFARTDVSLRGNEQVALLPRASVALMYSVRRDTVGFVMRIGYQILPWSDATSVARLDFSGAFTTIGLEFLR